MYKTYSYVRDNPITLPWKKNQYTAVGSGSKPSTMHRGRRDERAREALLLLLHWHEIFIRNSRSTNLPVPRCQVLIEFLAIDQ